MVLISLAIFVLVVIFISKGVIIVRQAEEVIVERLGSYNRTLSSGLNFIVPIIDAKRPISWKEVRQMPEGKNFYIQKNVTRIDLRETVYDFPKQNVITSDNVTIQINALLYFQVMDSKKVVYEIANLPDAIEKLTQTTLRNVIGELSLDETLISRDTINSKLRVILDEATDKWGVKVNRVELQDIIPPKEIRDAMEKQMKAERTKRAAILTAEGEKQARILNAEGIRDSNIAEAEGEKRARILEAEGSAEARIAIANAESLSIQKVAEGIGGDKQDPVNYLLAIKYIEAFQNIATKEGDKTVFMPYETQSMLSSLGAIREMWNLDKS